MSDWSRALAAASRRGEAGVLVSVAAVRGSAPREAGTRMVVLAGDTVGTIGGGHLEHRAISIARELLDGAARDGARLERFPLGAALGQCCGGAVQLLFERIDETARPWVLALETALAADETVIAVTELVRAPQGRGAQERTPHGPGARARRLLVGAQGSTGALSDTALEKRALGRAREMLGEGGTGSAVRFEPPLLFERLRPEPLHVALFGAGHVGRAVVGVLGQLPCRVTWIDSRAEAFPRELPPNVRAVCEEQPEFEVERLPGGACVLIMTHDHALDEAICARALRRTDLPWCGLIGSLGKRRRFERRLRLRGLAHDAVARLHCPIGIAGIDGRHPGEIAVSVCAQLLGARGTVARRLDASDAANARERRGGAAAERVSGGLGREPSGRRAAASGDARPGDGRAVAAVPAPASAEPRR